MKQSNLLALCLGGLLCAGPILADDSFPELQKCYQRFGQLEETTEDNKKVTQYKTETEVAAECNKKIVAKAMTEKNATHLRELANIVGKNTNWAAAMPIYKLAAKQDPKMCVDKDSLYALELALARPADYAEVKESKEFMGNCWPKIKDTLIAFLKDDQNGYVKEHLCAFLKLKKTLPSAKRELCGES